MIQDGTIGVWFNPYFRALQAQNPDISAGLTKQASLKPENRAN
jgi:hypothetical protein